MLAVAYKYKRDESNAALYHQRAVAAYRERNLPSGLVYERMAGYLIDVQMLDTAEVFVNKALGEDPATALYQVRLGEILLLKGDVSGAEEAVSNALSSDSSYFKGHLLLGKILEQKGDHEGAIRHYRSYLLRDSTSLEVPFVQQRLRTLEP